MPACFIYKLHNMRNSSRNKLIIFHQFLERIVGEGLFRGCFSNICELGSLCRDSNEIKGRVLVMICDKHECIQTNPCFFFLSIISYKAIFPFMITLIILFFFNSVVSIGVTLCLNSFIHRHSLVKIRFIFFC